MSAAMNCRETASAVQKHERTAREVVDTALAQAERLQEKWRAFITLTPELARKQAEQVDQRLAHGEKLPLAGVPFGVKDLIDVAGVPTTGGSKAFADRVPKANAGAVERLIQAGAVVLGKLNLHECAFGFTGENPHYGDCRNPWDSTRIAGGSSSGSAVAVALDICPFTLGSDTGGSIRLPAALCGVTGLKPTYGRVGRSGGIPLSWTMDHVGSLARSAADTALVLETLAGHDPADETSSRRAAPRYTDELDQLIKGLRIGVPKNWFFEALAPEVAEAVMKAIDQLAALGGQRVEVTLPHLDEVVGAHRAIIFSEAGSYFRPWLNDRGEQFGDAIRPLLQAGLFLPAVDYLDAQRARGIIRAAWRDVFRSIDCLVTPTSPIVAPRFGQQTANLPGGEKPLVRAFLDLTLPFNFTGHPALSIPCGFSRDRLPIGLQLVGHPFAEGTILRIAHQYQRATNWHTQVPPASKE
jgi:aspartyl-tRNA(Asn)/glutamyl-tRNA(Gln) amidotransferase subunit A